MEKNKEILKITIVFSLLGFAILTSFNKNLLIVGLNLIFLIIGLILTLQVTIPNAKIIFNTIKEQRNAQLNEEIPIS